MAALNAGDNQVLFDTMRLPRVRISGDGVAIYGNREDLEKNYLGVRWSACLPSTGSDGGATLLETLKEPR